MDKMEFVKEVLCNSNKRSVKNGEDSQGLPHTNGSERSCRRSVMAWGKMVLAGGRAVWGWYQQPSIPTEKAPAISAVKLSPTINTSSAGKPLRCRQKVKNAGPVFQPRSCQIRKGLKNRRVKFAFSKRACWMARIPLDAP